MNFISRTTVALGWMVLALGACSLEKDGGTPPSDLAQACLVPAARLYSSAPDQVFPDNLASYEDGSIVLQPKTGQKYRCKRYPYSVFCRQWSEDATRFEPGTGENWMAAWDLL